MSKKVF